MIGGPIVTSDPLNECGHGRCIRRFTQRLSGGLDLTPIEHLHAVAK